MRLTARAWSSACRSGGKSAGIGDVQADVAQGVGELDPVGVGVGLGGRAADQRSDGIVGQQVAVDLLADHVRGLGAQDAARSAQLGLDLVVGALVVPAAVVGLGQFPGHRLIRPGQVGDQADQVLVGAGGRAAVV